MLALKINEKSCRNGLTVGNVRAILCSRKVHHETKDWKMRYKRITKEEFYKCGGMSNMNQFRKMISKKWFYYSYN